MALGARDHPIVAQRLLAPERRLLEGELELALDVPLVPASHAEDPQQVAQDAVDGDVADVHEAAGKRPAGPERRPGLLRAMTEAIVHAAAVGVREHLIGQGDLLEALVGVGIVLVAIGVVLRGQPLEGALDFLGRRITPYSEDLVVVPRRHASRAGSSTPGGVPLFPGAAVRVMAAVDNEPANGNVVLARFPDAHVVFVDTHAPEAPEARAGMEAARDARRG